MVSRRDRIHEFYRRSRSDRLPLLEKSAADADRYGFKGAGIHGSAVVRTDLNGYSAWAREQELDERVNLLNDFFTAIVVKLELHKGVYFRDEGDCLVSLFSEYLIPGVRFGDVAGFCRSVASQTFGDAKLTAKTIVAFGDVAYFQKAHEVGTNDWSAEGDPFVQSARLEQAVQSKQRITYYKDQYDKHFESTVTWAAAGAKYYWLVGNENVQVPGLQAAGGWVEVVHMEYIPGGRAKA